MLCFAPSPEMTNEDVGVQSFPVSSSFSRSERVEDGTSLASRNALLRQTWISSVDSKDTDPSVLVNGHFDSPLISPGAGDCGSCIASMVEVARLMVDSGWAPANPVIFLFNGAEKLFTLGSDGLMKTHKWCDTIGAFINVEASGTGGPDLVCQSGPSSWPSHVYVEAAIYPMAHSAALQLRMFFLLFLETLITIYSLKRLLFHAVGIVLAIAVPIAFSLLRFGFTSRTMNWFAQPYLAFMMFIPSSLVGLSIPRLVWRHFTLSQDVSVVKTSKKALSHETRFWGAFAFYSIITLKQAYLVAGLSGGFLTFFMLASMLPAWISLCISVKSYGYQSLRSTILYVIPLVPFLAYSVYFGGSRTNFLIEKMGMMGAFPPPYGMYVPDIIVAAMIGIVTGWCMGPVLSIVIIG